MIPLVSHYKTSINKLNYLDNKYSNQIMLPGMAFTIEPIIMMYPYDEIYLWEDNWTAVCPNNPSAQWEHIVLITENGHEVLTKRNNEILL